MVALWKRWRRPVVAVGPWARALAGRQTTCLHDESGAGELASGAAELSRDPWPCSKGVRRVKGAAF